MDWTNEVNTILRISLLHCIIPGVNRLKQLFEALEIINEALASEEDWARLSPVFITRWREERGNLSLYPCATFRPTRSSR